MKSNSGKARVAAGKSVPRAAATKTSRPRRIPRTEYPPVALTPKEPTGLQWTFLTNHAHVLVLLARNPSMVLREVAVKVGITERAVQRIIADLEAGQIIAREKVGRQNRYQIQAKRSLRHPIESHRTIGELLALLNSI